MESRSPSSPRPSAEASADSLAPPSERAREVVERVVLRRRGGERVADDEVIRQHPELEEPLREQLRRAALVELARASSGRSPSPLESLLDRLDADPELAAPGEAQAAESDAEDSDAEDFGPPSDQTEPAAGRAGPGRGTLELDNAEARSASAPIAEQEPPAWTPERLTWFEPAGLEGCRLDQARGFGEAARFRPTGRPPAAVLRILDDDQAGGELARLRAATVTIGRERGDIQVPHDPQISALHAEIQRVLTDQTWRWELRDLGSTNGIYIKARRVRLRDGDQLIFASRLVRFSHPSGGAPSLAEARNDGRGELLDLVDKEYRIGRDRSVCCPFLAEEPTLDARFARLVRREEGKWDLWSDHTVNGLWVKVDRVTLQGGSVFQLGQQRFSFHTP